MKGGGNDSLMICIKWGFRFMQSQDEDVVKLDLRRECAL